MKTKLRPIDKASSDGSNRDEEDNDTYTSRIRKTGCLELHEKVLECYYDSKDWRQCQGLVKEFRECYQKYENKRQQQQHQQQQQEQERPSVSDRHG